jgi:hypothetical protein
MPTSVIVVSCSFVIHRVTLVVNATLRAAGRICGAHICPDEGHEINGIEIHGHHDRRPVELILRQTRAGA